MVTSLYKISNFSCTTQSNLLWHLLRTENCLARPGSYVHPCVSENGSVYTQHNLHHQGSTLQPVGSPMRLDFIQWQLTFSTRSPIWPLRFLDFFLRLLVNGVNVNLNPQRIYELLNFQSCSTTYGNRM